MKRLKQILVAVVPLVFAGSGYADGDPRAAEECWQDRQDRGGDNEFDGAELDLAMAVDEDGNIYVTYPRWKDLDSDYEIVVKKLAPDGTLESYAIAMCDGYAYVTGESKNRASDNGNDVATIKYNASTGSRSWVRRYNGLANLPDYAASIVADEDCNVYVGGSTYRLVTVSFDYLVMSYTPGGTERWVNIWDGPGHIEGCAEFIWDMTICSNVLYATGQACGGIGTGLDYGTIAVDCVDGDPIAEAPYGGAGEDIAWGIAADSSCYIYVTGKDEDGGDDYLATVKYDSLLNEKAVNKYPNPSYGRDIVVDDCDYPYATGWRIYTNPDDPSNYFTIKYQQHDPGDPTDFDREWIKIQYHDGLDKGYAIVSYACETVYVTGESEGDDGELDIVTKKYSERGACFNCWTGTCEENVAEGDCQGPWEVWDQCGVCSQYASPYPEICTVACCESGGECVDTTVSECLAQPGAEPQALGTTCDPTGACCLPDRSCIITTEVCCEYASGSYQHDAAVCLEPQACCFDGGSCELLEPHCCEDEAVGGDVSPVPDCLGDTNPPPSGNGIDDACEPPVNDLCGAATEITTLPYSESVWYRLATSDPDVSCNDPECTTSSPNGVWWHYKPTHNCDGMIQVTSDDRTATAIFTGNNCDDLSEVYCHDSNESESFSYSMTAGVDYWIMVSRYYCLIFEAWPPTPVSIDFDFDCAPWDACCDISTGECTDVPSAAECTGVYEEYYQDMHCPGSGAPEITCEILTGACCNDSTGDCDIGINIKNCLGNDRDGWTGGLVGPWSDGGGPTRFIPNGACEDFYPPCGQGACCYWGEYPPGGPVAECQYYEDEASCTERPDFIWFTYVGVCPGDIGFVDPNQEPAAFEAPCPPPPLIPTVSEWGLIIMSLLLLMAGTVVIARRRSSAATV